MTELAENVGRESMPDIPERVEMAHIIAVTQEIFPNEVEIETGCDESDPAEEFIIITVNGHSSDFAELTKRRLEWHRRVQKLQPDYLGRIKLSVVPG